MRRRILPFDIWLCLALAFLVSLGTGKVAEMVAQSQYEKVAESRQPAAGEIGGAAGEELTRAQSVEDLLSHDTFTVVSPGIEFRNRGGGYYQGKYFQALTLPSGELVAAWINSDSIREEGGSDYFSSDKILPVGRVVYADLEEESTFLDQIEYSEPLSRHDFYVDMVGESAIIDESQVTETSTLMTQLITIAVLLPVFHMIGSKLGLFPAYFVSKKKKGPQWE